MKKRKIKSILWTVGILLLALFLALVPVLMQLGAGAAADGPSILSVQAGTGEIRTDLAGAGSLREQRGVEVEVPSGVMLKELLVSDGERVDRGHVLAKVDSVSVMSTVAKVQQTLETLNEQITEAADQKQTAKLKCPAKGRVVAIYAREGDSARDLMLSRGALAIVSLDGMLTFSFHTDRDLAVGDEVTVRLSDGTKTAGRVDSVLAGLAAVTLSDEAAAYGQHAQAEDPLGRILGSGVLHAHNEWRAAATSGTVESVQAEVGEMLDADDTVCTLQDADSAELERLYASRRVYEDMMTELFVLYQERVVKAPESGAVTIPEDTDAFLLCAAPPQAGLCLLANAPDGNDEASYVNMAGVVTAVGEGSLSMNMRPMPLAVEDYLTASVSRDEMTVPMVVAAGSGAGLPSPGRRLDSEQSGDCICGRCASVCLRG